MFSIAVGFDIVTLGFSQLREFYCRLLLLPKHLPVGLAIGIKAIMFTPFPSGFQFGPSDVPVRTAFLQHSTQVLPKFFDGRSAKKPVAVELRSGERHSSGRR